MNLIFLKTVFAEVDATQRCCFSRPESCVLWGVLITHRHKLFTIMFINLLVIKYNVLDDCRSNRSVFYKLKSIVGFLKFISDLLLLRNFGN